MKIKQTRSIAAAVVLIIIAIATFLYYQSASKPDKFGGFKEGTEQYYGYRYAQDNLKSVDQCDDEKDDPSMNFNEQFFQGCQKYFEHK